jgi:xylan 1,4-beta-xylosidase
MANNGIDLPVFNVFRMFSKMDGNRVAVTSTGAVPLDDMIRNGVHGAPDVSALASVSGKKLNVMMWHYHDDDIPGPDAAVDVTLDNLPLADGPATLTHYRIDAEHSNSFEAWKRMGAPTAPNDGQYAQLLKSGQLEQLGPPETIQMEKGRAVVHVQLPRQAVSLLVLE